MFIKELEIERFKAIDERRKFKFSKVNLIVGDNGSGKSALLAGISYPIVDTVTLSGKIEDYCNWNHDDKYFFIKQDFDHKGENYLSEIEYKNKTFKTLTVNGKDVYENKTATDTLAEIIDPKLTHYSAISNQHSATDILFETPAKRLEKLKVVLKLEKVGLAADYLKTKLDEYKTEIEQIETKIATIEENRLDYKDVPDVPDISKEKAEYEKLHKAKESYESQKEQYEKDLGKLNKKKSILAEIQSKQEKADKLKDSFSNDIDYDSEINSKKESFYSLTAKLETYSQNKKRVSELNESLQVSKESLEKVSSLLKDSKGTDFAKEIEVLKKDIESINEQSNDLSVKMRELENKIELAEQGLCPTCGQEFHGDLETLKTEQSDAKKNFRKLKKEKSDKETSLSELIENKADFEKNLSKSEQLTEKIADVESQLETLSLDDTITPESVEKLKSEIDGLQSAFTAKTDYDKLIYEIETKSESLPDIDEKDVIEPKPFDNEKYEKLLTLVEENSILEKKRESALEYNSEVDKQIKVNKRKVQSLKTRKEELQTETRYAKSARQSLDKEFSAYLIDKGTSYIRDKMNEFFQKTYGRYYVDFRQDKNSVEFFYSPDNENFYSVNMASGFEKQLLAVSFRLALCSMQNLNFLILDEIDSDASDENSMKLYSNILESGNLDQVFIVTHHHATQEMLVNDYNAREILL